MSSLPATAPSTFQAAYQAAKRHAVWVDLSAMGRLGCIDRDRLDLPHRLSTNDLLHLQEGQGCATVFTTAIGRIIDRVVVLNRGESALLLTGRGRAERIRGWLQRNVFFNDRFQSQNLSDPLGQIGIFGAHGAAVVEQWWAGAARLPPYHFLETALDAARPDEKALLARVPGLAGDGYWVIASPDLLAMLQRQLSEQSVVEATREVYDALRIEAGLPDVDGELTEDYIPLELGLSDAVSFHKGCYIGQEIIARLESRGKLAKMLARVRLSASLPAGTPVQDAAGKSAGLLTSVATLPADGHSAETVGLAVLKSALATAGEQLHARREDGTLVAVSVLDLAGVYAPVQ